MERLRLKVPNWLIFLIIFTFILALSNYLLIELEIVLPLIKLFFLIELIILLGCLALLVHFFTSFQEQKDLATKDELTKIFNRRGCNERLREEISRAERYNLSLAVVAVDIDNFKAVNDQYGHLKGDQVLMEIAQTLDNSTRIPDVAARWGGEEFVLILPETSEENAFRVAERLRKRIAENPIHFQKGKISCFVTCSFGLTGYDPKEKLTPEDLTEKAFSALKRAKEKGKNCVSL